MSAATLQIGMIDEIIVTLKKEQGDDDFKKDLQWKILRWNRRHKEGSSTINLNFEEAIEETESTIEELTEEIAVLIWGRRRLRKTR